MHTSTIRQEAPVEARIGPNAVTQMAAALDAALGGVERDRLFAAVGRSDWLERPPTHMVPEPGVIALHQAVRARVDSGLATRIARDAGLRTGTYLLAHRIPGFARALLRALPAGLACRALLEMIRRNAWTFCGSGRCEVRAGRPAQILIADCPLCRGLRSGREECDYYAATFEHLARTLVSPRAFVREITCGARGDSGCRFEIAW